MKRTNLFTVILCGIFVIAGLLTTSPSYSRKTKSTSESVILLITNNNLKSEWQTFANWKKRIGKPVKIITIEEIESNYKGKNIQEKIRQCCLNFIKNHGTKWVILGGDSEEEGGIVPHLLTPHKAMGSYLLPTDNYYISETNWNANGNDVYGEFEGDKGSISYTNDNACIGRIPVRTKADVRAYTEKVIAYESKYPENNFAKNIVYTCNASSAYPKLSTSCESLKKTCPNLNLAQYYTEENEWTKYTKGRIGLNASIWVDLINKNQIGKIHIHGHGMIDFWVMNDGNNITSEEVDKLTNVNAYPIITTVSCFTGQFDGKIDPCIAESMLRKKDGGAILILCPSRPGIPVFKNPSKDFGLMMSEGKMDATTITMTKFWEYGSTNHISTGEVLSKIKKEMSPLGKTYEGYHFVLCELNLLGDPTLEIRSTNPTKAKLKTTITPKEKGCKIVVNSSPNATVCIWKTDEIYEVKQTDDSGIAIFDLKKVKSGSILLSASGYNYNATLGKIEIK